MIRPRLDAPTVVIAEDQQEYKPVTAAIVRHPEFPAVVTRTRPGEPTFLANTHVIAFRPTDEERQRLIAGEDLYVALLSYCKPMHPIMVSVGPEEFARWFSVEVER